MAVGDVIADTVSEADDAYLDVQPAAGTDWVINNIYYAGAAELYKYDGTRAILFETTTAGGALLNVQIHVNNTDYLRIRNVSGDTAIVGYDGMITATS
jgi:hypothetical protein